MERPKIAIGKTTLHPLFTEVLIRVDGVDQRTSLDGLFYGLEVGGLPDDVASLIPERIPDQTEIQRAVRAAIQKWLPAHRAEQAAARQREAAAEARRFEEQKAAWKADEERGHVADKHRGERLKLAAEFRATRK